MMAATRGKMISIGLASNVENPTNGSWWIVQILPSPNVLKRGRI
jgi:hypothetical protein